MKARHFSVGAVIAAFLATAPVARAQDTSDHALLDEPGGDVSVQCGARAGSNNKPKAAAFTMHITVTNRADLGGAPGKVRVTYNDTDFVDYWIDANDTQNISLAGGGTLGVDDIITVSGDGAGGSVLIGQASLSTDKGKPHPGLAEQDGDDFCTTTQSGGG